MMPSVPAMTWSSSFQGNRNPFIDHPEWATPALFTSPPSQPPASWPTDPQRCGPLPPPALTRRRLYTRRSSTVDPVLLLTTCPDRASAERIAHALVGERLAACVTRLDGAQSTYRWQGEVTTDAELQLLVKTTSSRVDDAIARIVELHPYELPECIAVETSRPAGVSGLDRAQTREDTD